MMVQNFIPDSFEAQNLLISFCNQNSSPNYSLLLINPKTSHSRWIDFSSIPAEFCNSFVGTCGIFFVQNKVLMITQGSTPILALVDVENACIEKYIPLTKSKDPHSLVYYKDFLYIISTGTNEIYKISFKNKCFGKEELFWRYPGVGYSEDEVHLNGLTLDREFLVASCFGPKKSGGWASAGKIFYVESGISICENLAQPHSPNAANGYFAFAESASKKVHIYKLSKDLSWKHVHSINVNGYARGLTFSENNLWIGISATRQVSRSQSVFFKKKEKVKNSQLIKASIDSGELLQAVDLTLYGREPYDLLALPQKIHFLDNFSAIKDRVESMEYWTDRYLVDLSIQYKNASPIINDKELVTVIIPTYNRAHLVFESIKSVLSQTYRNIEVLVVDDGSTDNTQAVVASIHDPRLHYIHQKHFGRSAARNRALMLAKGNYITFLDSDDLYLPNKIELQVKYLQDHPGTGMIYTSAFCIDEQGMRLPHKYLASISGFIYQNIAFFQPVTITLPTVMTYKSILNQVKGFDENLDRFEDTDLWRRISKLYRIDAISEFTCLLRTHSENHLLNQNPKKIISSLHYYSQKILKEDKKIDFSWIYEGLESLYKYYAHAFLSVPEFSDEGKKLMVYVKIYESRKQYSYRKNWILKHKLKSIMAILGQCFKK